MGRILSLKKSSACLKKNGVRIDEYEPGCILDVGGDIYPVNLIYGGILTTSLPDGERLVIDDGHRNKLARSGYIVFKNYDNEQSSDTDEITMIDENRIVSVPATSVKGIMLSRVCRVIKAILDDTVIIKDISSTDTNDNTHEAKIYTPDQELTIRFDTVKDIVNYNTVRKDNGLTFYSFDKNMDRNCTIYMTIFSKRRSKSQVTKSNVNFDELIRSIMIRLGEEYHYISMPVKGMVTYWSGI